MKRIYITVFLVSCSVLMLEVSLTRLFSIRLWYHFAFMVISIAMLGIGSAGTVLSLFTETPSGHGKRLIHPGPLISICSFLAGISIMICYTASNFIPFDPVKFSWDKAQFFYLALYCLILSVPFFFAGILIAAAFLLHSDRSMSIYGYDLFGAGTGSLAVLFLLNHTGAENAVLAATLLCLSGALFTGGRNIKVLSIIFITFTVLLFFIHPGFLNIKISPYKNFSLYLKYPGAEHSSTYHSAYSQIDTFKSPAVRFAPGLSLKYLEELPEQRGLAADADRIDVITDPGDRSGLKFLEFLPSSIAYRTGRKNNVLVLDPKGGLQVLMAEYFGSNEIHKVESNPLAVKVIRGDLREFSGGIYDNNTWTGYGRNFLEGPRKTDSGQRRYDIIDMPMTGTSVSGAFGISEDYRYTVEAFKKYFNALKKDGIMSISLYLLPPPRTEFRILATIIAAIEQTGKKNISSSLAAVRSWDSITILVKKSVLNDSEISQIRSFAENMRFDLLYYPGIKEEDTSRYIKTPSDEYFNGFRMLINPETRPSFINNYLFDIKPVYDEAPFFNYYMKLGEIKRIYQVMGHNWLYFIEEGYLLPVIFVTVLILSIILIILPVILKYRLEQFKMFEWFKFFTFLYFAMIGLGFMFVEVTFIQKAILLLENPSYSVAVVLTAILISSGTGSILSSRFHWLSKPYSLLLLAVLIIIYSLIYPVLLDLLTPFDLKTRMAATAVTLIPPGFFMGMPFPYGMKLLGERSRSMIPWAWAVNASLSVLAPIIAIMVAIAAGFKTVLWLGALTYLLAFLSLKRLRSL